MKTRLLPFLPLSGAVFAAVLLLAACGGPQTRVDSGVPSRATTPSSPATTPKGGGYYKDDGPGDEPPPDLAAIPDAVPRAEPVSPRANRPYRVMGQDFVPRTTVEPYRKRGVASWYGRRFHGLATSSGEPYDMYAMTAAHPTLPIPSYARVTHVASGRSVVVRVNDRGPFLHGRIMDLSYTAAWKLGYVGNGSAEVDVEQILPGESAPLVATPSPPPLPQPTYNTPPPADDPLAGLVAAAMATTVTIDMPSETPPAALVESEEPQIFLQLGAFSTQENARNLRQRAHNALGDNAGQLTVADEGGHIRVYVGPYVSMAEARAAAEQIGDALGIRPFAVQRENP
jgi:rare lipoprotein A